MKQFETEHYIFHYGEGTSAERDIERIAACQEACFQHICRVLGVTPAFKIEYFLCDSPEEVGRIYGDDEPCNGFTDPPDKIYAVYNDQVRCIGFHEDAHIISYTVNRPDCPGIREGLAMCFDRKWWGIQNLDWTAYFLKHGQYLPVDGLLDKEMFFDGDCSITYPIMGAFVEYLIATYGTAAFMAVYSQQDIPNAMEEVYRRSPAELNQDFVSYVKLFSLDPVLEGRMAELLSEALG